MDGATRHAVFPSVSLQLTRITTTRARIATWLPDVRKFRIAASSGCARRGGGKQSNLSFY
jgi:hypothetical protein